MTPAAPPTTPPRPRRRLTRFSRVGLALVVVLTLLESSGLAVRYLMTDHRYVISDNAQVDGNQIDVNAPRDGVVTDWRITPGSRVDGNEVVGRIRLQDGSRVTTLVRSPGTGTVARTYTSEGVFVTAGSRLATAFDDDGVYVTARIAEADVRYVRVGAPTTVRVDAGDGEPVAGVVAAVGAAAAGASELDPTADPLDRRQPVYPGSETDPRNAQKVDQYVPVRITLVETGTTWVTPGMNVGVEIQRP